MKEVYYHDVQEGYLKSGKRAVLYVQKNRNYKINSNKTRINRSSHA